MTLRRSFSSSFLSTHLKKLGSCIIVEKKMVVIVKGLIIYNGEILLLKRSSHNKFGGGEWELAGGKLKNGEELEESLIREIEEETGLKVIPEKILYATTINDDPDRQLIFLHYLCSTDNDEVTLSNEHTDFYWANQEDAKKLLRQNILQDFEKYHIFKKGYIN